MKLESYDTQIPFEVKGRVDLCQKGSISNAPSVQLISGLSLREFE